MKIAPGVARGLRKLLKISEEQASEDEALRQELGVQACMSGRDAEPQTVGEEAFVSDLRFARDWIADVLAVPAVQRGPDVDLPKDPVDGEGLVAITDHALMTIRLIARSMESCDRISAGLIERSRNELYKTLKRGDIQEADGWLDALEQASDIVPAARAAAYVRAVSAIDLAIAAACDRPERG